MSPVETFELILGLLAFVVGLTWLAQKLHLPPASALLLGGTALAFTPALPTVSLNPELALVLFLPPLLMDGAFYTALGRFRRHLPGIISLSLGAVLFTTLVVGLVAHAILPSLPLAACFALGAIVSPPDAVAARAILQQVRLPRRLSALLEGESLLNDATGLVLFRFAVVAAITGSFSLAEASVSFVWLALGGVLVGLAIGTVWLITIRRIGNSTLMIVGSLLLSWMAYIVGERLHVSGVIATVTAGMMFGWYQHVVFPAMVRLRLGAIAQTLNFVLEALVFILIGFTMREIAGRFDDWAHALSTLAPIIAGTIAAVVLARFVYIAISELLLNTLKRAGLSKARPLGWRQSVVLSWAGMRGVVTLAAALSLPTEMPGRDIMIVTAFAVIIATVVGQGVTLGWVIKLVKPVDSDPPAPVSLLACEAAVAEAKYKFVEGHAYDDAGKLIHPQMLSIAEQRMNASQRFAADDGTLMDNFHVHMDLLQKSVGAGREELIRIHRAGQIEDEVLHNLERDLDIEEMTILAQRDA
nr:Na+/H+ antiporter [uncultured Sphingomonas sp.]